MPSARVVPAATCTAPLNFTSCSVSASIPTTSAIAGATFSARDALPDGFLNASSPPWMNMPAIKGRATKLLIVMAVPYPMTVPRTPGRGMAALHADS